MERYIALDMYSTLNVDLLHATLCVLTLCISLPRCTSLVVTLSRAAAEQSRFAGRIVSRMPFVCDRRDCAGLQEAARDERGAGGGGEDEEEEEEEGPPTDYDAAGVLSTQLASFSELRLLRAGSPSPGEDGGAPQAPTRALHPNTLAGGAREGALSHAHAGIPRGHAHAGGTGPDAAGQLHAESAPAAAEPGASELAQQRHSGAVVTAHQPPGAGGTLQNPTIGVTAGGAMRGGSLRVPQPPARHTMAAQPAAGISQPDTSPDLNPDPRKGAAGAARRALASGLAPLAVARRMRGAAGGDAEGGAWGGVAARYAGTPAPRPAPGRPPARPAVVPGRAEGARQGLL